MYLIMINLMVIQLVICVKCKLYIGRATKGENFTKTMKRERE